MQKNFFDKCLLFRWLNWICFLLSNVIWQDAISLYDTLFHCMTRYFTVWHAISLYFLLRANQGKWLLFEKLKGNYSMTRKKQPVRVICENSCMLKEAATTRSNRSLLFCKIGVLKNFAISTGKHPCWSLF